MRFCFDSKIRYSKRSIVKDPVFTREVDYLNLDGYDGVSATMVYETTTGRLPIYHITATSIIPDNESTISLRDGTSTYYVRAGICPRQDEEVTTEQRSVLNSFNCNNAVEAAYGITPWIVSDANLSVLSTEQIGQIAAGKAAVEIQGKVYRVTASATLTFQSKVTILQCSQELRQGNSAVTLPYTFDATWPVLAITGMEEYFGEDVLPTYVEHNNEYFFVTGSSKINSGTYRLNLRLDVINTFKSLASEQILCTAASHSRDGSIEQFLELYSDPPDSVQTSTEIRSLSSQTSSAISYICGRTGSVDIDIETYTDELAYINPKFITKNEQTILETRSPIFDSNLAAPTPFRISIFRKDGTYLNQATFKPMFSGTYVQIEDIGNLNYNYGVEPSVHVVLDNNNADGNSAWAYLRLILGEINSYLTSLSYTVVQGTETTRTLKSGDYVELESDGTKGSATVLRGDYYQIDVVQAITQGKVVDSTTGTITSNARTINDFSVYKAASRVPLKLPATNRTLLGVRYTVIPVPYYLLGNLDSLQTQSAKGQVIEVTSIYGTPADAPPVITKTLQVNVGSTKNTSLYIVNREMSERVAIPNASVKNGVLELTLIQNVAFGSSRTMIYTSLGLVGIIKNSPMSQITDQFVETTRNNLVMFNSYASSMNEASYKSMIASKERAYSSLGDRAAAVQVTATQLKSAPLVGKGLGALSSFLPNAEYLNAAKQDYDMARNSIAMSKDEIKRSLQTELTQLKSMPISTVPSQYYGGTGLEEALGLLIVRPSTDEVTQSVIGNIEYTKGYPVNVITYIDNLVGYFEATAPYNPGLSELQYNELNSRLIGGLINE